MAIGHLELARKTKDDEFYTLASDIEDELLCYVQFNKDVFRGKSILLPCDNPEMSNFVRIFVKFFKVWGVREVVATSFTAGGRGRILTVTQDNASGLDADLLPWESMLGDGDFRSAEVTAMRDAVDMVFTNPPFSLMRAFMKWVIAGDVQFSIMAPLTSVGYREIFNEIAHGRMWNGHVKKSSYVFAVLKGSIPVEKAARAARAARSGFVSDEKFDGITMNGIVWLTNIDHARRHQFLPLNSMEHNLSHHPQRRVRETAYRRYDNIDAIEVPFVDAIPNDFDGVMGVPLTFIGVFCPEQFDIVGFRYGDDGKDIKLDGRVLYSRVLIRRKKP